MNVHAGPVLARDPHAKTKALATLRQATWDATQFVTYDEVREYVESVLREAECDEP